jgi:putative colanic acid biosynthesis acetyltransferase WcaF
MATEENTDIGQNRAAQKYSGKIMAARVAWGFGRLVFRLTPRPCFGVRRAILRLFGATVGDAVNIYPSAVIYYPWNLIIEDAASIGEWALVYNLGPVKIGARATISQRVHLCAGSHDYTCVAMPLLKLPIVIEADAWVCADAFVGPNVTVGAGTVVGARSVVVKDLPAWKVAAGNPAKVIKARVMNASV